MFRRLFVLFLGLAAAAVLMAVEIPETITLDKAQAKWPPVTFTHKKHEKMAACDTCHHTQKGLTAEAKEVVPCSSCHLDPEKPEIPSMRQMSLKKNPFHIQCINCHKKEGKGPTKCAECHKK